MSLAGVARLLRRWYGGSNFRWWSCTIFRTDRRSIGAAIVAARGRNVGGAARHRCWFEHRAVAVLRDFRSGPRAHRIPLVRYRSVYGGSELVLHQAAPSNGIGRHVRAARGVGSVARLPILFRSLRLAPRLFSAGDFAVDSGGDTWRDFPAATTGRSRPHSRWGAGRAST